MNATVSFGRARFASAGLIALMLVAGACGPGSPPDRNDTQPVVRFTDITEAAGLASFRHVRGAAGDLRFPEINGAGAAFIDYDGDGWQDILLAGGGVWPDSDMDPVEGIRLFRNNGDGTFTEVTTEAGLSGLHEVTYGFAVADFDGDGPVDFAVTTVGQNYLYRNLGGRFVRHATLGPPEWSNSAAFFDADGDGDLDLFVTNYVDWSAERDLPCLFGAENRRDYCTPHAYRGLPPRLFANDGGRFADISHPAGITASPGKSMGVALLDFNNDGRVDIAVSNDGEPDHLFRNNGDGTFSDIGFTAGMAVNSRGQPQAGMGIDAGDLSGTGRDAVVVGNFSNETMGVFEYDGTSLFLDQTRAWGVAAPSLPTLTFGLILFDADLDGNLDIFAANGHISLFEDEDEDPITVRQPPHLFLNMGDGRFVDAAADAGDLGEPLLGRGAAFADIDRDGDLDVLVTENDGPVRLYRNETRSGTTGPSFLRFSLTGKTPNTSAIGATVRVYAGARVFHRMVRSGSSYLSQSELPLTFGLGDSQGVDSVVVIWPSGARQMVDNPDVNRAYELREEN